MFLHLAVNLRLLRSRAVVGYTTSIDFQCGMSGQRRILISPYRGEMACNFLSLQLGCYVFAERLMSAMGYRAGGLRANDCYKAERMARPSPSAQVLRWDQGRCLRPTGASATS